jgi:hypothetical protein
MSKSRTIFFKTLLPALENVRFSPRPSRNNQIKLIEEFFSEIGRCTVTPPRLLPNLQAFSTDVEVEAFIAAFIERMSVNEEFFNQYFNLITFKLGLGSAVGVGPEDVKYIRKNIVGPERQALFIADGGVSGSNYIEDLLDDLLDTTTRYDGINECVNLLMCPLKVYFKLFIDFIRPSNPRITFQMAIKYLEIFMDKSELIIIKKLELIDFSKMQSEFNFKFDDDIINVLKSRFIMCLEFFKSTLTRSGFSKDLYDTVLQEFNLSHDLRGDARTALGRLKGNIRVSIVGIESQERSDDHEEAAAEDERLAFFRERDREVDRMIDDLNKLIPLINASSEIFDRNSELASAATVPETSERRQRRRQLQLQHDSGGGRKKQKKCKNNKKCKNTKKCKNNKKCKNTKKYKR